MINKKVSRREIWATDLGQGLGSEHSGQKYCLVVQNDIGNKFSGTTVVIPITSAKKNMPTHVPISILPKESYVVCEQIRIIDKRRLKNKIAILNNESMMKVDSTLKMQLGLQ